LKHEQFSCRDSPRLPIVAAQGDGTASARLISEEAHDSQGILRGGRVEQWKAPHDSQGYEGSRDGIRVNIWQAWRDRSFKQNDGTVTALGQGCRLREEAPIYK
jgi:hypothetical protein